jgi:hypothetical protein
VENARDIAHRDITYFMIVKHAGDLILSPSSVEFLLRVFPPDKTSVRIKRQCLRVHTVLSSGFAALFEARKKRTPFSMGASLDFGRFRSISVSPLTYVASSIRLTLASGVSHFIVMAVIAPKG